MPSLLAKDRSLVTKAPCVSHHGAPQRYNNPQDDSWKRSRLLWWLTANSKLSVPLEGVFSFLQAFFRSYCGDLVVS
jgi:hypothetical protein